MKITRKYLSTLLAVTALALALDTVAAEDAAEPAPPEREAALDPAIGHTPEIQPMSPCITCVGNYNTGQLWKMGTDCADAATATENAALAAANAHCQAIGAYPGFPCNFTFFVDDCYDKQGGKVVDGHATFGCLEGEFLCPQ